MNNKIFSKRAESIIIEFCEKEKEISKNKSEYDILVDSIKDGRTTLEKVRDNLLNIDKK